MQDVVETSNEEDQSNSASASGEGSEVTSSNRPTEEINGEALRRAKMVQVRRPTLPASTWLHMRSHYRKCVNPNPPTFRVCGYKHMRIRLENGLQCAARMHV